MEKQTYFYQFGSRKEFNTAVNYIISDLYAISADRKMEFNACPEECTIVLTSTDTNVLNKLGEWFNNEGFALCKCDPAEVVNEKALEQMTKQYEEAASDRDKLRNWWDQECGKNRRIMEQIHTAEMLLAAIRNQ